MLFNEPKLLKSNERVEDGGGRLRFSALQRAEIAEILTPPPDGDDLSCFSALQRAEIAEIVAAAT